MSAPRLHTALAQATGAEAIDGGRSAYLHDATEARALHGRADAIALPRSVEEVAGIVAWCYEHSVPMTVRGGGTGFAAGAVPIDGGVVISLERLRAIRSFDPELWRLEIEAGLTTAEVQRLARENGLLFPPDPGAAEQSQIGGNIATNAGGPHAFKYGVTGRWVTGLEAVIPPGEVIGVGGAYRKDVAGYDIKSLLIGSEGTLAIITSAWLSLVPVPEATATVVGFYPSAVEGCTSITEVIGNGLRVAALEYLDETTMEVAGATFPGEADPRSRFAVIADLDGDPAGVASLRAEVEEVVGAQATEVLAVEGRQREELWRWRDGVSIAVTNVLGGKRRRSRVRGMLFYRLLEQAVQAPPRTYRSFVVDPRAGRRDLPRPPPDKRVRPGSLAGEPLDRPWRQAPSQRQAD